MSYENEKSILIKLLIFLEKSEYNKKMKRINLISFILISIFWILLFFLKSLYSKNNNTLILLQIILVCFIFAVMNISFFIGPASKIFMPIQTHSMEQSKKYLYRSIKSMFFIQDKNNGILKSSLESFTFYFIQMMFCSKNEWNEKIYKEFKTLIEYQLSITDIKTLDSVYIDDILSHSMLVKMISDKLFEMCIDELKRLPAGSDPGYTSYMRYWDTFFTDHLSDFKSYVSFTNNMCNYYRFKSILKHFNKLIPIDYTSNGSKDAILTSTSSNDPEWVIKL